MRAARVVRLGGPRSVEVQDVEEPVADDQVVIDVHAAGVIFPDVLQTHGQYQFRHDLPFTLGGEVAGVVRSSPPGGHVREGDRVVAFGLQGGFAESFASPPDYVFPLAEGIDFEKAAAVPVNYLTCHFALTRRGGLVEGETVLVHGAAGGIGTAACQLAGALGARVIAVVSTPEKEEVARAAGADEVVLADGFLPAVRELTGGRGVDVVLDPVGGERFTDSLRALAPEGRVLVVGFAGGAIPEVKVNRLLLGNTAVAGVAWGEHFLRNPSYSAEQWAQIHPLLEAGSLDPVIGAVYPLREVTEALLELEERRARGKVVLVVRD